MSEQRLEHDTGDVWVRQQAFGERERAGSLPQDRGPNLSPCMRPHNSILIVRRLHSLTR